MTKLISYIKARLSERSTWAGISAAIVAAAAVAAPFSYMLMAVGIVMAFVPTGGTANA
jgi:hypothetical protein